MPLYWKVNFPVCYFDGFSLFFVAGFVLLFLEHFFLYFSADLTGFLSLTRYGVVKALQRTSLCLLLCVKVCPQ